MMLALVAALVAADTAPVSSSASANVSIPSKPQPGLNLSGCEFAENAALCPTAATVDAYIDMGFRAFRIPVESRELSAAIPKLKPAIAEALKRNALTVVDLHDYLPLDPSRITPLILQVSAAFGPTVWIDYDNEPKAPTGYTGDAWVAAATATNEIIANARKAGVSNVLVAEWPYFSGNYRFVSAQTTATPCQGFACGLDRVGGMKDPLGKTVLGPHRYYDADKSGTHPSCSATGYYWAPYFVESEKRGYKTLIGETAWGNAASGVPVSCVLAGNAVMDEIRNSKLTAAYMIWGGGGSWSNSYLFSIPPRTITAASPYVWEILADR